MVVRMLHNVGANPEAEACGGADHSKGMADLGTC